MGKKIQDLKKLTDLTNEFLERFLTASDPRDYDKEPEYFIQQSLTAPSVIAAEIIDKIAGTFHLNRKDILNQYIKKLKLALRWVDHKKENKGNQ